MAKTKISEYDATAANNTDIDGVNIAESCPPSGINNAIREVMAHLKDFQSGTSGDTLPVSSGGTGSGTASGARTALGLGALSTLDTVDTAQIDADAIDGTLIADDSIDSEHIVDGSIDTAHIADDQITSAKIADNAVGADALNVSGDGTSGQVLQSDGDGSFSWGTGGNIGVGQSWTDVTSSRALATTYTNNTGKPIMVNVSCTGAPQHAYFRLKVGSVIVGEAGQTSNASSDMNPFISAIVPNGSTYRAEVISPATNTTLARWSELR